MAPRAAEDAKIRIQTVPFFAQVEVVQIEEIRPAAWQRRFWYAALTALAVVALVAVLTPSGDPYTLMVLSVPMCLFYEISILFGRIRIRRAAKAAVTE